MKKITPLKKRQIIFFTSAMIDWLALDLITKYFARTGALDKIVIIPEQLYFSLHYNKGIAFGLFFGHWSQIIISIFILVFLVHYGFNHLFHQKEYPFLNPILLGIITGGALGNLTNRLIEGYVTDFIVLRPIPVFNIADIGITVGLILLAFLELKKQ